MSRRCISNIIAALALLLLVSCSLLHCAAAARPLRAVAPFAHQENGAKAAAAADGLGLLQNGAVVRGNELKLSVSEMKGAETEEQQEEEGVVACEEGNDECLQRRLLRDAHLDYIYTQHKGNKP